jgi:mono/diheme cytochrome c family protein
MTPLAFMLLALALGQEGRVVTGVVKDGTTPVPGAVVRVQGTPVNVRTNERGEFTLELGSLITWPFARLTAYAPGYYISGPFAAMAGAKNLSLALKRHPSEDDPNYEWISAFRSAGQDANCQNCHSDTTTKEPLLPFDEWVVDAHGTSGQNRRFLSMYNGTDLSGRLQSPLTRFTVHKDYGRVPLPPDPNLPYYGPGFKLDFPASAGNCAACHLPNAAVRAPYDTDPNTVTAVGKEGVGCDFCHKIWAVKLEPRTGLPYPNTPGVLAMELRRPSKGHQLFIGPFDDVAPGEDTFSPLQNQSQICAPCHFAQFWGVQVYNSFGEWLESPYSDPVTGQTCQDCHMPRRGINRFARFGAGAQLRDPKTVFSHLMPGAADVPLLQDTARLGLAAWQDGTILRVKAAVTNEKAGHHIPTDHPARNILLVISATDAAGRLLPLVSGPRIPDWGGEGSRPTDYAGRPGRGYAKILEELWTEITPTAAYWNPTVLREDTRLAALATDLSEYEFRAPPEGGPVKIEARLVFRRAFKSLARMKQWDDPDILMEQAAVTVAATPSLR